MTAKRAVTSSPAVNGGASLPQQGTRLPRFGFRTVSPGVSGAGFVPRSGASCGTATCAPIRKRVIATRFLNVALSRAVEPRGSCAGSGHTLSAEGHQPGLRSTADVGGMQPDSQRQPSGVGGTRSFVYEKEQTKRLGSGRQPTAVGPHHVGFTPGLKAGILSLRKIAWTILYRIEENTCGFSRRMNPTILCTNHV